MFSEAKLAAARGSGRGAKRVVVAPQKGGA